MSIYNRQLSIIRNLQNNIALLPIKFHYFINTPEISIINELEEKTIIKNNKNQKEKNKETIIKKENNLSFFLFLISDWEKGKNVVQNRI